jgi:hypothetical protein
MVVDTLQRPAQTTASVKSDVLFLTAAFDRRGVEFPIDVVRRRATQARDNLNKLLKELPK